MGVNSFKLVSCQSVTLKSNYNFINVKSSKELFLNIQLKSATLKH